MELEIIRLVSSVENSVDGVKVAGLNLVYTHYLQLYNLYFYDYIIVHQIDERLQEFVRFGNNQFRVNIRHATPENYHELPENERNRINLEIVHEALIRISKQDSRMKADVLEKIKEEIIGRNFIVDIPFNSWTANERSLKALAIVVPREDWFDCYIVIEENDEEIRRYLIMRAKPIVAFIDGYFYKRKWETSERFVINSLENTMQTVLMVREENMTITNLSGRTIRRHYLPHAVFIDDGNIYYKKWLNSLPSEKI